jgi:hypothetical protein
VRPLRHLSYYYNHHHHHKGLDSVDRSQGVMKSMTWSFQGKGCIQQHSKVNSGSEIGA